MRNSDDHIKVASGSKGIERLEARLHGQAFSPHRHDTYAIGITLSGVQSFGFRGQQWHCLPGQCHILHPDELHDGGAGTEDGFSYRIVYIDPALIQNALDGRPLPFVAEPVLDGTALQAGCLHEIWDLDAAIDETELVVSVADLLTRAVATDKPASGPLDLSGLSRVRDLIAASPARRLAMNELERLSGLDRWTLARQFRAAFGTSPSRFRTLRQLDRARRALRQGSSLVAAAIDAGFADQSHMTRQFKLAYGLTPARWAAALT